eukprot:TRINITY_DN10043_c0_g1_i1.p1 TRINITY_DN10043_c0_g1~~TRINITY_DN10043_c0_g1_i1.p1  ORF type:complete len:905 (+),score=120.82 TRINITY_DN10043_c0_g1_i1:143-2857(+)
MATGLTWIQKLDTLDEFLPLLIHQIRSKIEKEYFSEHIDFVLAFFPRYYKQHRLLRLCDLIDGVSQATVKNISPQEGEKYAQEFATMWILEHVGIYELFEEELKSVQEDFEQLADLDSATSRRLADGSTQRFGPVQTYIFVVLMSVLLDPITMASVREAAESEIASVKLDLSSTLLSDAPDDINSRDRLARSDGLELLKAPHDKPKQSPVTSPKKKLDSEVSSPTSFVVGSFPPHSDPTLHAKTKARILSDYNSKQEVINRRHSSQLNFASGRSPFLKSSQSHIRVISSPIRMSQSSSSSISHPDASHSSESDSELNEYEDGYTANMVRSSSELTTKTAPESGRSMMTAVRDRLRSSRENRTAGDTASVSKPSDIYQKYLKQHRLEGWLFKQTRNPDRPDSKYLDQPWRRRWVVLGDSSISYFEDDCAADPRGCIPLHIISKVGTASTIGANDVFYIEAGSRQFLFKSSTEEEMKEWLFTVQCAIAVNLERIVDPKSRRRAELLSDMKKWWKRASTDWGSLLLDIEDDEEEDGVVEALPSSSSSSSIPSPLINRPDVLVASDLRVHVAACARQGCRDYMEDEYRVVPNLPIPGQEILFASVYDGHGGGDAASFCRINFADDITQEISRVTGSDKATPDMLASSLMRTFEKVDGEFIRTCREDRTSGTTATVVLVTSTHIVCANVGDSRAILVSSNRPTKILSVDHRPNLESERARIIERGGHIEDTNEIDMAKLVKLNPSLLQAVQIPQRLAQMVGFVMTSRIEGSLCVSRAIGDAEFKGARRTKVFGPAPSPDKCDIVICEPSITVNERDAQNDEFLIIASDGVWDFLETDYVAEFVREEIRKGVQPAIIAENLVTKALTQGSQDNITAIILFLNLPQGGSLRRSRQGAKDASSSSWRTVSRS